MIFGLVLTIAILVGIVLLVVWAVRSLGNNPQRTDLFTQNRHQNAEQILKARYAKGEITKEGFEEMRATIK